MRIRHATVVLLFASLALAGCGGGGGGGGGGSTASGGTNSQTVTLSGSLAQPMTANTGFQPMAATAADFSAYALYCVTFSTPARSGSGQFGPDGTFSVTLDNAAGLPMGCFITNVADGSIVTTLTFQIGASSGHGNGNSGSAAFPGGAYSITITFDPVAKTASADVQTVASGTTGSEPPTFDPAALAGPWTISCGAPADLGMTMSSSSGGHDEGDDEHDGHDNEPCRIDGMSVFIDVVAVTVNDATSYALGAWPDEATFIAAGMTEGMAGTQPAGFTAESLVPEIANTSLVDADPTRRFNGFTHASFDYDTRTMAAADAWNYLNGSGVNDALGWSSGDIVSSACAQYVLPPGSPWPDNASLVARICLVKYLANAAKKDESAVTKQFVPRLDNRPVWENFVSGQSDTLTFAGTAVGDTPSIRSRIGLLDLQLAGNTAIASDFTQDSHNEGGDSCWESHHASIVFLINSDGTLTGWFSRGEVNGCSNSSEPGEDESDSFQVTFSRPVPAL